MSEESPVYVRIVETERPWFKKISKQVPLAISIFAISLSVWQAIETRNHNQLGLKPLLVPQREMNFAQDGQVGINVTNEGPGPAIIKNFVVYLDGKPHHINSRKDLSSIETATSDIFVDPKKVVWKILGDEDVVGAGGEKWLYATTAANVNEKNQDRYIDLIQNRILLKMKVCSVYRVCEEFCSGKDEACAKAKLK